MIGPYVDRMWRAVADTRRRLGRSGSAAPALRAVGGSRRSNEGEWADRLAERHDRYRAECPPVVGDVAVVCVSNRPHLLHQVVAAVARQSWPSLEFVLVTHSDAFVAVDVEQVVERLGLSCPITVLRGRQEQSLGACLNGALDASDARFVAKFDDDDHYGPEYLSDALRAHGYAGAGVVGKHSYYAYMADADRTVLRFPSHEFRYSSTLAGGTLVIDRARTDDLTFPDLSLGEDRGFLARCHRRGISTFSADRFNFVQTRGSDNTWRVDRDDFLHRTRPVASGLPLDLIER